MQTAVDLVASRCIADVHRCRAMVAGAGRDNPLGKLCQNCLTCAPDTTGSPGDKEPLARGAEAPPDV